MVLNSTALARLRAPAKYPRGVGNTVAKPNNCRSSTAQPVPSLCTMKYADAQPGLLPQDATGLANHLCRHLTPQSFEPLARAADSLCTAFVGGQPETIQRRTSLYARCRRDVARASPAGAAAGLPPARAGGGLGSRRSQAEDQLRRCVKGQRTVSSQPLTSPSLAEITLLLPVATAGWSMPMARHLARR